MIYLYRKHKKVKQQREARAAAEREATQDNNAAIEETDEKDAGGIERPAVVKPLPPPIEQEEDPAEKKARRIYRWKLVLCLFPSAFLAAIDTTIVATSLTTISSHFSKFIYSNTFCILTNNQRQTGSIQLDCYSIHFNLYCLYPSLWSNCRHVWPSLCPSDVHVLHGPWISAMCCSSNLANVAIRKSISRTQCGGLHEHGQDHLSRQSEPR
jgi:hypothetical protein